MRFDVVTLFPEMFAGILSESILKRAMEKKLFEVNLVNLRDFATDKHKTVDDRPYGGGAGMVIKVDVMERCLMAINNEQLIINNGDGKLLVTSDELLGGAGREGESIKCQVTSGIQKDFSIFNSQFTFGDTGAGKICRDVALQHPKKKWKKKVVLLTPHGKRFNQSIARRYAKLDQVVLVCGHYEGFDQRIHDYLIDEELSLGNFVLTGGEIPAMSVLDATARLVPGVIKKESASDESFSLPKNQQKGRPKLLVEYPQYTRPEIHNGWKVPEILLSGDHKKMEDWKQKRKRAPNK